MMKNGGIHISSTTQEMEKFCAYSHWAIHILTAFGQLQHDGQIDVYYESCSK